MAGPYDNCLRKDKTSRPRLLSSHGMTAESTLTCPSGGLRFPAGFQGSRADSVALSTSGLRPFIPRALSLLCFSLCRKAVLAQTLQNKKATSDTHRKENAALHPLTLQGRAECLHLLTRVPAMLPTRNTHCKSAGSCLGEEEWTTAAD